MTAYVTALPQSEHPWAYGIEFDYSPEMVHALKSEIPARSRKWNPAAKQWWIRAPYIETACFLAGRFCGGYELVDDEPDCEPVSTPDAYATLHLLPTAPPWLIHDVYRTLAKRLHPDAGGDLRAMQQVNAAYEQLVQQGVSSE